MKAILNQLFEHKKLSREQAGQVLTHIAEGKYNEAQVAAFISVYLMRSVSVGELQGFRDALLDLCLPIDFGGIDSIDLCGTGGDGKNTFNISTLASFVTAGAGYKVTKHGNYGVSSVCGSSNVLEYLGYHFTTDSDTLKRQLDKANICFLHAPLFHPSMKFVAPIRRQLGVKTFFNMLGPIVNPARPSHQLVGVYSLHLARLYQYLHQNTAKKFVILHALDGYDEISLTGKTKIITYNGELVCEAADLELKKTVAAEIEGGGTVEESAAIFMKVLNGEGTEPQNNVVLANAAMAIHCFDLKKPFSDCLEEARASLFGKKALASLKAVL